MKMFPNELVLPPRTIFRKRAVVDLFKECAVFGKRGVLVHGRSFLASGAFQNIAETGMSDVAVKTWQHPGGEPTLHQLEVLLSEARAHHAEWIAGVGGGSVIDLAKACAGLLEATRPPVAYHDGAAISTSKIPFLVAPTTAGTGSEATVVCVLTNSETNVKKSFRHPSFMARLVILDPELLAGSPPEVIAHSGMDAFTQAIESYVSTGATWFSDQFSLKALSMIFSSIRAVFENSYSDKKDDLLAGSYLAGLALSNARLGIVHGLAHPLGARYHVPHGLACAVCLPHAIKFNHDAMGVKYTIMSETIGGDLFLETNRMIEDFNIRSPFAGQSILGEDRIIEETLASGSAAANPRKVTETDVEYLLKQIFAG
ncbi:MAG: iron-containing alcohol dehydrogenase [Kiritimatiellae bacterium]|nr:iron-containing alcohol dehydrogenase [Kiritimatiellia bacterium]MDD5523082.1 iron-containing alcohol dehydrogenase [Kiritimatiellia bacterium]